MLGGITIRYEYMSIRQLEELTAELKEEAKHNPEKEAEYLKAYKALEEKIRERDRKRPRCVPWRFEHAIDVIEEF